VYLRFFFLFGDFVLRRGDLQGISFFFVELFGDRVNVRLTAAFLLILL
jgi:hypothetical protein